ncbi:MAG: response regulator [Anaerolineae bacterium]|jgi:CheY-like chemotaxis protein|nr:response regulator [Anaerolineae bacterium]
MSTILVVDDDKGMLRILELLLTRAHYQVVLAKDGITALDAIRQQRVDLILMDDMMPGGLSGIDACRLIKSSPEWKHIPIVIHSAGPDILDQQLLLSIGAVSALRKPCEPQVILETVAKTLASVHH